MSDFHMDGIGDSDLAALFDVSVEISVVLGTHAIRVGNLLRIGRGAEIYLDRRISEPVDIFANERLIARGEVCIVGEKVGVTITEMIKADRG
jgi:flagellar motor switch protein FliN